LEFAVQCEEDSNGWRAVIAKDLPEHTHTWDWKRPLVADHGQRGCGQSNQIRPPAWPVKANSHRHTRDDKTVLSVSRPLRRCKLDSRQLKTVADGSVKSEHVRSNRPIHTGTPDTTRTGLS